MATGCDVSMPRRRRNKKRRRAIFTICSANYISYAATLMQSVRAAEPDSARFIIIADRKDDFHGIDIPATMIGSDQLKIPTYNFMQLLYDELEFCSALKPFSFQYLMNECDYDEICYLDADILLLESLTHVWEYLNEYSVVLTPHVTVPSARCGGGLPELTILKSGVFNLGFAAMRDDHDARRLLSWWAGRCALHCRVNLAQHMFADQRWMDYAPSFVERLYVLRHPGCNVAYWNLSHRQIEVNEEGRYLANGEALIFFHFSGIIPDDDSVLSRHDGRLCKVDSGPVAELSACYRARLHANGWQQTKALAYGFGSFADGRPIEPPMRHWLQRAVDQRRLDPHKEINISSDFFDKQDDQLAAENIKITRFMHQLWLDRADLQLVFDIYEDRGLKAYFDWFIGGGAAAEAIDERNISSARVLLAEADSSVLSMAEPPWPALSAKTRSLAAGSTENIFRGDVSVSVGHTTVLLPRQAALNWELRQDLQARFDLTHPEDMRAFVGWAITTAIDEGSVDPALFTDTFLAEIGRRSYVASQYDDVPVSEGMLLTRGVQAHRANLARWQEFPADRLARLSHGLWFAFLAPRAYRWPHVMVSELLRYFAEPTDISALGFRFNRAELALWETRTDVQAAFPLTNESQRIGYLHWLVTCGLRELSLTLDEFDPRLTKFLSSPSRRFDGLSVAIEMVHAVSPKSIQGLLNTEKETEIKEKIGAAQKEMASIYAGYPLNTIFKEHTTTVIERVYRPIYLNKSKPKTKTKPNKDKIHIDR